MGGGAAAPEGRPSRAAPEQRARSVPEERARETHDRRARMVPGRARATSNAPPPHEGRARAALEGRARTATERRLGVAPGRRQSGAGAALQRPMGARGRERWRARAAPVRRQSGARAAFDRRPGPVPWRRARSAPRASGAGAPRCHTWRARRRTFAVGSALRSMRGPPVLRPGGHLHSLGALPTSAPPMRGDELRGVKPLRLRCSGPRRDRCRPWRTSARSRPATRNSVAGAPQADLR